ncbi:Dyp-type peroxidase [Demequina aurantiaca]|uniref:Dyp-type peroxidase n=1 Tax=Demequina aurantiaca TaxID=676200 RepID=UPI00078350C7|nr:Dyp-type peroxidase [Demequina aurantiaca]
MTPTRPVGDNAAARGRGATRRGFLFGGAAAGVGVAAGVALAGTPALAADPKPDSTGVNGSRTVAFHGTHQAGIETPVASYVTYLALDLHREVDADGLRRLMKLWSDDAARLTAGTPALADTEPHLAEDPAGLTVTFGFGPGALDRAATSKRPSWLRPLPAYDIDKLEERWSGGDLIVVVSADDQVPMAHATRMILKDGRGFASLRWRQDGFRRAYGSQPGGTTMRNLFDQVDGTANPRLGTPDFDTVVWATGDDWMAGGTSLVLRRIEIAIETWDEVDTVGRENAIGRTVTTGAPLTGTAETDEPDFEAIGPHGFPVISDVSHVRRAHHHFTGARIFRRGYNYDLGPTPGADDSVVSNTGLLFASYQADVDAQYVPIQEALAKADLMNVWTTPIGSAVFAIPPGCAEGEYVGQGLLG